jgi:small subunit ribosomal protein S18
MPRDIEKSCQFCAQNIKAIDYKDAETLRQFISAAAKIMPRKRSGVCLWHQRKLARAIKRARIAALLPFVTK